MKAAAMFDNKVLVITGGTGSFGKATLRRFLDTDIREIRVFSRDEKKQDDMRKHFNHPKLKFYLGDVRDRASVDRVMRGADYCFHAAALKQVPSCEFHPMEAVRTNVLGTENVLEAAIAAGLSRVICLSTDKAVYPINAMGMSKAMMEKVMVAASRNLDPSKIVICGTRYGNVMASRGSVIPLFIDQIRSGSPITLTNPDMTRFMMALEDAVELVLFAFKHGNNGDIFVQKAPGSTVGVLAQAVTSLMGAPEHPIVEIGTRHGEKLHETLLGREEYAIAQDMGGYYRIAADSRDLNYAIYVEQGEGRLNIDADYNSSNTHRLSVDETKALLMKVKYVVQAAQGGTAETESD